MDEDRRREVQGLARAAVSRGESTAWFEELYARAAGDEAAVPWQDGQVSAAVDEWLERHHPQGDGRRCLVVGCGLGDDAEALAARGFLVSAFDISPTAISWCRRRHPESRVEYRVADLLAPPAEWNQAFALVIESLTLQALPASTRAAAFGPMAAFVAPGGELLVLARARPEAEPDEGPPWSLTPTEMEAFPASGLEVVALDQLEGTRDPDRKRWRGHYRRPLTPDEGPLG